jgi:hypothetical protein
MDLPNDRYYVELPKVGDTTGDVAERQLPTCQRAILLPDNERFANSVELAE